MTRGETGTGVLGPWTERLADVGRPGSGVAERRLVSSPLLAALRAAGTRHVYGDTADVAELAGVLSADGDALPREVDGNTVNQPLVRKVLDRLLDGGDSVERTVELLESAASPALEHVPWIYTILCARVGNEMTGAFSAGRSWEASLQLHMALGADAERAVAFGRFLHRAVPGAIVKVPFTPDRPHCLLVARDLEREGIPVNVTSTFSARQAAVAALVADATRTNVFMGRIEQGLEAELLGEHVCLEAQRAVRGLRERDGVKTELIVASMRDWRTFERLAGCDAFTAPCDVLADFLGQDEVAPADLGDRLDTSLEHRVSERVEERLGVERIARLHAVEPELLDFLRDLRQRPSFHEMSDGEELYGQFEAAGFGDLFHDPTKDEREEARAGKLPDLDGLLAGRIPLDTHYSILANEDFRKHQEAIDAEIERRLAGAPGEGNGGGS